MYLRVIRYTHFLEDGSGSHWLVLEETLRYNFKKKSIVVLLRQVSWATDLLSSVEDVCPSPHSCLGEVQELADVTRSDPVLEFQFKYFLSFSCHSSKLATAQLATKLGQGPVHFTVLKV